NEIMIKAVSLTRIREYTKEKAAYGDGSTDLVRADDPVSGRGDSNSGTDLDLAGGRSSCSVDRCCVGTGDHLAADGIRGGVIYPASVYTAFCKKVHKFAP